MSSRQFGFRKHAGCDDALADIVTFGTSALASRRLVSRNLGVQHGKVLAVAVDFTDAFSRVTHRDIAKALSSAPFATDVLRWLNTRTFEVWSQGKFSDVRSSSLGVPQGSVLGPALWNLVMDTLIEAIEERFTQVQTTIPTLRLNVTAYADDLTVALADADVAKLELAGAEIWATITDWATYHRLPISGKTKSQLWTTTSTYVREIALPGLRTTTEPIKILGVLFDPQLRFAAHYESLLGKLQRQRQALTSFARCSHPADTLAIYRSQILSRLLYGSTALLHRLTETTMASIESFHAQACKCVIRAPQSCRNAVAVSECGFRSFACEAEQLRIRWAYKSKALLGPSPANSIATKPVLSSGPTLCTTQWHSRYFPSPTTPVTLVDIPDDPHPLGLSKRTIANICQMRALSVDYDIIAWCDGSVQRDPDSGETLAGGAFLVEERNVPRYEELVPCPAHSCSYTAETSSFRALLRYLLTRPPANILILQDAQSVMSKFGTGQASASSLPLEGELFELMSGLCASSLVDHGFLYSHDKADGTSSWPAMNRVDHLAGEAARSLPTLPTPWHRDQARVEVHHLRQAHDAALVTQLTQLPRAPFRFRNFGAPPTPKASWHALAKLPRASAITILRGRVDLFPQLGTAGIAPEAAPIPCPRCGTAAIGRSSPTGTVTHIISCPATAMTPAACIKGLWSSDLSILRRFVDCITRWLAPIRSATGGTQPAAVALIA